MVEKMKNTPVQAIQWENCPHHIYMKRDDLTGFSFGGNKVRIAGEFYEDMIEKGCDCMISYGSSRSNMCRSVANMCRRYDIPCYVITPCEDVVKGGTFNSQLVDLFGAKIRYCEKKNVAQAVRSLIEELKGQGLKPYYIFGNCYGQGNEEAAAKAYIRVYQEILEYQEEAGVAFDRIFLASATGMTQGGLIAGQKRYGGTADIVGISVARPKERGREEISRFAGVGVGEIHFEDQYCCGGYGLYDSFIEDTIRRMMDQNGIPLDPTYTGKAFAGMLRWLKEEHGAPENILFIHTGGTPLYFDYLNSLREG